MSNNENKKKIVLHRTVLVNNNQVSFNKLTFDSVESAWARVLNEINSDISWHDLPEIAPELFEVIDRLEFKNSFVIERKQEEVKLSWLDQYHGEYGEKLYSYDVTIWSIA